MTEHPTAAFADQIQPGMVIDPAPWKTSVPCWIGVLGDLVAEHVQPTGPELVTITGVRRTEAVTDVFGHSRSAPQTVIHLIGTYLDGRPYTGCLGGHATVHVHEMPAVPDTAEGAAR